MKKGIACIVLIALMAHSPVAAQGLLGRLARSVADVVNEPDLRQAVTLLTVGNGAGFENYGNWQFRVDEVLVGSDGEWQAVIAARNLQQSRLGMVASEIKAAIITADGESLQNWGELYRASSQGGGMGLDPVPGTLWVEPGDTVRFRLRFAGSRGLQPSRIRLSSTGATAQSHEFSLN